MACRGNCGHASFGPCLSRQDLCSSLFSQGPSNSPDMQDVEVPCPARRVAEQLHTPRLSWRSSPSCSRLATIGKLLQPLPEHSGAQNWVQGIASSTVAGSAHLQCIQLHGRVGHIAHGCQQACLVHLQTRGAQRPALVQQAVQTTWCQADRAHWHWSQHLINILGARQARYSPDSCTGHSFKLPRLDELRESPTHRGQKRRSQPLQISGHRQGWLWQQAAQRKPWSPTCSWKKRILRAISSQRLTCSKHSSDFHARYDSAHWCRQSMLACRGTPCESQRQLSVLFTACTSKVYV